MAARRSNAPPIFINPQQPSGIILLSVEVFNPFFYSRRSLCNICFVVPNLLRTACVTISKQRHSIEGVREIQSTSSPLQNGTGARLLIKGDPRARVQHPSRGRMVNLYLWEYQSNLGIAQVVSQRSQVSSYLYQSHCRADRR